MSLSYPSSDSNLCDPHAADATAINSPENCISGKPNNLRPFNTEAADPPSASPTPLRGQVETNQPIPAGEAATQNRAGAEKAFQELIARRSSAAESNSAEMASHRAAFDLGWQGYLQRGRQQATPEVTFENVEPELAQLWRLKEALQPQRLPWEEAKETARDAWDRVRDALAGG